MYIILFITLKIIIVSTLKLRNNYYYYKLVLQLYESFYINNTKHNTFYIKYFINSIW